MTSFKARLLEIKQTEAANVVARLAAGAALEIERLPYCFSIDHSIGAPKFLACPLKYDFTYGKTVGIKTTDRSAAEQWIVSALLYGYTVTRAGAGTPGIKDHEPYGEAWEIRRIRDRAVRHQAPPLENDDDIPF